MSIQDMEDLKQQYLDEMKILPIIEPEDSPIIGDEDLSTIPEKESNEFIKSSVEDLVPIPSESEDTDDESLPDEDVSEDNVKIYSNPLFEFDDEYISSDVNPLFDKVIEDIENKDSFVSILDELALLVIPLPDAKEDIDEIDAFLDIEILLSDDTTPNLPPEVFLDRDPRGLSDINDLKIMVKVFDPEIHEKISPTYVSFPFKDRHYLFFKYIIRIFLPYFTYPVDSPFLLSSGSEDTIFDPGISALHFFVPVASHQSGSFMCFNVYPNILNESSMEICSSTCFVLNITMI
uniref:Reverse transcriptase domain-containing protein n=1 Tax=Tanacetum cinerariifolium TaxID=118510 RepID=A0A699HIY7_TANCI|nr:hypothetical protein [Tanacetum cinerariifolium]